MCLLNERKKERKVLLLLFILSIWISSIQFGMRLIHWNLIEDLRMTFILILYANSFENYVYALKLIFIVRPLVFYFIFFFLLNWRRYTRLMKLRHHIITHCHQLCCPENFDLNEKEKSNFLTFVQLALRTKLTKKKILFFGMNSLLVH